MAEGRLSGTSFVVKLTLHNLQPADVSAVHVHEGSPFFASAAAPLFTIADAATGPAFSVAAAGRTITVTADAAAKIRAGGTYFNLHTAAAPNGLIRAQIIIGDTAIAYASAFQLVRRGVEGSCRCG